MDAKIKAKWVAALRSGDYKQTTNKLRSSQGFCCLGVLCDIIDPTGWKQYTQVNGVMQFRNEIDHLPVSVVEEVGEFLQSPLIRMNDSGKPFDQIADYIEKNL